MDALLVDRKFLCGDAPTEADVRLFPTIFRHDPIYFNRMKLNKALIADYPHLWRWMCDFYALPGVKEESPLRQMKQGYFGRTGNSTIPIGPEGYPELLEDRSYAAKRAQRNGAVDASEHTRMVTVGVVLIAVVVMALTWIPTRLLCA